MKINIGCGPYPLPGYINIDVEAQDYIPPECTFIHEE